MKNNGLSSHKPRMTVEYKMGITMFDQITVAFVD